MIFGKATIKFGIRMVARSGGGYRGAVARSTGDMSSGDLGAAELADTVCE